MRVSGAIFGRLVLSLSLGIGLVAGAGLAPVAADETQPPVSVAAPGSEAASQAKAADSGQDVVVDDVTTPTGVTVAHADGTFTRTEHVDPVRMETDTGWKDISTDLVPVVEDGQKVLKPEMTPVEVSLGAAGTEEMAVLDDGQGHSITQSWPFGDLPTPVVVDNTATYSAVLPGVDLIQIAHPTGVSQVLRIATAAAARDPRVAAMRIFLDTENTTVSAAGDGGLQAKGDDSGQVELRTASGQWWDSSQEGASATDPGNPGLTWPFKLSLGNERGQDTQVFGMNEVLSRPDVVYPIFVDPDWTFPRTSYAYVDDGYPTVSYWNGQYADGTGHVGFLPAAWGDGRDHKTRSFYQFSTGLTTGKVIFSARMNIWLQWSSSCTATPVSAWQVGPINTSTTWNSQPAKEHLANTQTVSKGNTACTDTQPQGTVGFDLNPIKANIPLYSSMTIGLYAGNEADPLGWKKFSNNPTLAVTYGQRPAVPTIYTITGGLWDGPAYGAGSRYVTRYTNPIYYVKASDPDGVADGNITVNFQIINASGTVVQTGSSPAGSPAGGTLFSLQSRTLVNGTYTLKAQSQDQGDLESAWMSFAFTVDATPPPAPVITATSASLNNASHTDNTGVIGETKYTLSLTKGPGSYDVEGFVYSIRSGPVDTTYPVNLTCGTRDKEFVVVCGSSASITVAAVADTTSVRAWAFDTAGNVNLTTHTVPLVKGGVSPEFTFSVGGEQHAVPATVLPVTLKGGASWVNVETNLGVPVANGCTGSAPADDGNPGIGQAMELKSSGDYGSTLAGAVDTGNSFSLALWMCPKTPIKATAQSVITQMAAAGSPGAALMLGTAGKAEFDQWTGANSTGKESALFNAVLTAGNWYYVAAVSDKINQQLRITLQSDGYTGTWTVATASATHISSPTTQPVLLGASGPAGAGQFTGQIFNPVMTKGVLPDSVFATTRKFFGTEPGVKK
jgi:hypothetical protein